MKYFINNIALSFFFFLSWLTYAEELTLHGTKDNLDVQPPIPLIDMTTAVWNDCLASFDYRDYPKALKLVDSLIIKHPDNLTYLIRRARCLSAIGKTEEALSVYDNLAQKFKDKDEQIRILSEKAVVLVQMNKNKDAIELIQAIDRLNPGQTILRFITCKSIVMMANSQYKEAWELLSNSLSQGSLGQYEDSRNNSFLFAELSILAERFDISLRIIDYTVDEFPMLGRYWLARAALSFLFRQDQVLYCLEQAEKCKDEPAVRGGILLMKVCYYADCEHDYSRALEYMQQLMGVKCQLDDFNKNALLATMYFYTKQYNNARTITNKLEMLAKADNELYIVFRFKLYIAHINKDGKEIQQLLGNNEKLCQYCETMNNGKMLKAFRMAANAYQQPSDNELAQLVSDYMADFTIPRKEIPLTVFFYSFDWDKRIGN